MSSPDSVADVEQWWLSWLRQQQRQIGEYLTSWQVVRAQRPDEFQWVVISLNQYLRILNGAVPAANTLSNQGASNFPHQLNTEMQLRQGTLGLYCKRRDIAATAMVNLANMQTVRNQGHTNYIDVMSGSCFACHTPGVVAGGGLCVPCARRLGYIF
jgi:hypothetical protein